MSDTSVTCKVLSIDAWRDPNGGWTWNAWHDTGKRFELANQSNRAILKWFRAEGMLASGSAGRVAVEDDGYNVVIMAKGTREPLFAIEYGAQQ